MRGGAHPASLPRCRRCTHAPQGRALDGLRALKRQAVSTKLLSDTQAGRRVKALAKHPHKPLAAAASEIVAAWKDVVRREVDAGDATASQAASSAKAADRDGSSKGGLARMGSQSTVGQGEDQLASMGSQATAAGGGSSGAPPGPPLDLSSMPLTGDTIRDKCRGNLAQVFYRPRAQGWMGAAGCAAALQEAWAALAHRHASMGTHPYNTTHTCPSPCHDRRRRSSWRWLMGWRATLWAWEWRWSRRFSSRRAA